MVIFTRSEVKKNISISVQKAFINIIIQMFNYAMSSINIEKRIVYDKHDCTQSKNNVLQHFVSLKKVEFEKLYVFI